MRAKIGKALRAQFEAELKKQLPAFEPIRVQLSGARGFTLAVCPGVSLYVMLQTSWKDDRFNISVGWGKAGGLPVHLPLPDWDEAVDTPGMVRLSALVRPFDDIWWTPDPADVGTLRTMAQSLFVPSSEEQCVERLPDLIQDALATLRSIAFPYWSEVLTRHGLTLPWQQP